MNDSNILGRLAGISTATLTTQLLKHGLRNVWLRGPSPLSPGGSRIAGPAFTLRFTPYREDQATPDSWNSPVSTRTAIEAIPEGAIAVVDAMGVHDAGIVGDILCARMVKRKVAGLVTDGVIRDVQGVIATGLPVWSSGIAAPPAIAQLTFVGWQEPIACGGVAVFPGDIIVADEDGAVVVPVALAEEIVVASEAAEELEEWILDEVRRGATLPGLYPPNAETSRRYEEHSRG
ncbi:UNVERIFIED_ORG: regulator of RNase E activity RraA [Arthrobacter sp. UYCu721]